jgi:hypothetical protein
VTKTPFDLPPTWTLAPPTVTAMPPTLRPSSTPFPTHTPPSPLPPSPTAFPPVHSATTSDYPSPGYGLIFLEAGVLREWIPGREITDLVTLTDTSTRLDRVQLFDISSGGALVAILRRNASGQSEIVLYDRAVKAIRWMQAIPVSDPTTLKLSQENVWIAYAGRGTATEPGTVGVVLVEAPDRNVTLAVCNLQCKGALWTPLTRQLVWSDAGGIWQVDPALGPGQTPKRLLEPPLQILNPGGQNVTGVYTLGTFSPSGRYMLLSRGAMPEGIPAVFDTLTGRVADVPGTFLYTDPGSSVVWLADDTLAVGRAGSAAGERPVIEIWSVIPSDSLLLEQSRSFVGTSPAQAPFLLTRLRDGGVRFAMLDFSTPDYTPGNAIYLFNPGSQDLTQLNALPFLLAKQAIWTPDGSGVLLLTAYKAYYLPANGARIYDMDEFLGITACCFAWIP